MSKIKENDILIESLEKVLQSIKFSNRQPISVYPMYDGSLADYGFLTEIKFFHGKCLDDFKLLEQSVNQIAYYLFLVLKIRHMNAECDIVCVEMLTLMAKTYVGARYLFDNENQKLAAWQNNFWLCEQFRNKVKILAETMNSTIKAHNDVTELSSQSLVINGVETVESLRMDKSSCGIFYDQNSFCIARPILRRRIKALPSLHQSMTRKEFAGLFPKDCPGCIALNIFCTAEVLNDSIVVHEVIKQLLNDPNGEIIRLDDVDFMRRRSLRMYKRGIYDPYPFMGNCIDFGMRNDFVSWMKRFGSLVKSQSFKTAMERDKTACVDYVRNSYFSYHDESNKVFNCEAIEEFCASILNKKCG